MKYYFSKENQANSIREQVIEQETKRKNAENREDLGKPFIGTKFSWFPGHMHRALKIMKEEAGQIDLFLEIRDARIPLSSRNPEFESVIKEYNKQKIILLNKFDICNQRVTNELIQGYSKVGIKCVPLSAQQGTNLTQVIGSLLQTVPIKYKTVGMWLMICGMPNVGKSTLINQLRQVSPKLEQNNAVAKATKTPCTTQNTNGIQICTDPLAFLVDSPGVMMPNIYDQETALKLSVVGCIRDKIVGQDQMVQYLLWALNKQSNLTYTRFYGFTEKCTDPQEFFLKIRDKYKIFNYENAYDMILDNFRQGKLGNITLDDMSFLQTATNV